MPAKITNQYVLTALACVGGFLFGFDISSLSVILALPVFNDYFGDITEGGSRKVSSSLQGGISASMPGGSLLGALVSGTIADMLGRKKTIFIGCIIWLIGSILASASQNVPMLIVARLFNGGSIGILSAQVPVYITELARPNIRGRLVGCQQWAITWGICIFYFVSLGCSYITTGDHTAQFRIPWALQMIPALVLMAVVPLMPESPRWLAEKGRMDEALQVLADVHAKGDKSDALVLAEFKEIETVLHEQHGATYAELFSPKYVNRLHIAIFTQIWAQLTGMNAMMYYITYIFGMAGKTGNVALISSSIQYIINVVMTVPALLFIDKWGRRPTLLLGALFMGIFMFANAGILKSYGSYYTPQTVNDPDSVRWKIDPNNSSAATGLIASTYLFVAAYACTWGPVSWVYPPELMPNRLRAKSNALSTVGNWTFNFALSYFVPPAFKNIQWQTYIVFGVFDISMFLHVLLAFPETKGIALEEIDEIFALGVPAWKSSQLAKKSKLHDLTAKIEAGEDPDMAVKEASLGYTIDPRTASPASEEKKEIA